MWIAFDIAITQGHSKWQICELHKYSPIGHSIILDFAGYFEVKTSTRRNAPFTKCYISLFVCLTTKAIHLELAHDISTVAFIAALNRFTARRGIPSNMYSDRGTNFIGTANELPKSWYVADSNESKLIQQECTTKGMSWHFNPARASHFGGLWEAGVKSVKTHLHRVLKDKKRMKNSIRLSSKLRHVLIHTFVPTE